VAVAVNLYQTVLVLNPAQAKPFGAALVALSVEPLMQSLSGVTVMALAQLSFGGACARAEIATKTQKRKR
jgi:hypothetical protein